MQRPAFSTLLGGVAVACRIMFFGLRFLACATGIAAAVSLASVDDSGRMNLPGWTNSAQAAAALHRRNGYATCGWIGVRVTPMTAAFADSLGMAVPYGAIFATPQPGSPAAKAGIEAGDVVLSVNGPPLEDARDFAPLISAMAPGSYIFLNTMRGNFAITAKLTVGSIKCPSQAVGLAQCACKSAVGNGYKMTRPDVAQVEPDIPNTT